MIKLIILTNIDNACEIAKGLSSEIEKSRTKKVERKKVL